MKAPVLAPETLVNESISPDNNSVNKIPLCESQSDTVPGYWSLILHLQLKSPRREPWNQRPMIWTSSLLRRKEPLLQSSGF